MEDVLAAAAEMQHQCLRDTFAFRASAENHRKWNVRFGGLTEAVSAILGTSVVAGLLTAYGVSDKGKFEVPSGWWGLSLFTAVILFSLAGPVLLAIRKIRTDAEDSAKHLSATSDCMLLRARLDSYMFRYGAPGVDPVAHREQAIQDLEVIRKDYSDLAKTHLPLTETAYKAADQEIAQRDKERAGRSSSASAVCVK